VISIFSESIPRPSAKLLTKVSWPFESIKSYKFPSMVTAELMTSITSKGFAKVEAESKPTGPPKVVDSLSKVIPELVSGSQSLKT
jgi:hypothetical protein